MAVDLFPEVKGKNECHHSQVMSAIIKNVRLRRADDATYWFTHFVKYWPEEQFRLSRRILILAGEDCIDVPVQWAVSDWFWKAINMKDYVAWYRSAVAQIHLICATDNWWKSLQGAEYMTRWRFAEVSFKHLSDEQKHVFNSTPLDLINPSESFLRHMHTIATQGTEWDGRKTYADSLVKYAQKTGNIAARLSAAIHSKAAKMLAKDDNYLGQALYRLTIGPLGKNDYPKVDPTAIHASVVKAVDRLKKSPEKTPKWVQDGIHCYGKDPRFSGVVKNMMGCCMAYISYGRLDPEDTHPSTFFDEEVVKATLIEKGLKWR